MYMNSANTQPKHLSTAEVAQQAGVHKDTLLRWLRSGLVQEPQRDWRGWRYFTRSEADAVARFAQSSVGKETTPSVYTTVLEQPPIYLRKLSTIDWDFIGAKTSYLTHGIHPYPAKFIPQIPNALIQELSSIGDTVADIFCGSGTTLVEALTLKRHAVGVDANQIACMISKVKTTPISESNSSELLEVSQKAKILSYSLISLNENELFPSLPFLSKAWRPTFAKLNFWFEPHVIEEIAEALAWCRNITSESARNLALIALSSIIVAVSKQDSDTRYVRREKNIPHGEVMRRFARAIEITVKAATDFSDLVESRFQCNIVQSSLLDYPDIPMVDLVICSPPYPNAYSYHLYHMTRMIWLSMDQPRFKREEIGSHRKYSSHGKNSATVETFRAEFSSIFAWLSGKLKRGGCACFVVGDSTLKGQRINNTDLISQAAQMSGFREIIRLDRTLQATKKAFNPAIGKIKTENIIILENCGVSV